MGGGGGGGGGGERAAAESATDRSMQRVRQTQRCRQRLETQSHLCGHSLVVTALQ